MRATVSLAIIGLLAAAGAPRPADAQILTRVKERVKQKAEARRRQTEEHLVERAAEPADSALERVMSPVDSAAGRAGASAGAAVSRAGRGADPAVEAETRLREQLAGGRADLPGLAFEPGTDVIVAESEPILAALAKVLGGESGVFLLQGRADAGTPAGEARQLADLRAVAVKNWLVASGVPGQTVFATGDGAATPDGALASVVRAQ